MLDKVNEYQALEADELLQMFNVFDFDALIDSEPIGTNIGCYSVVLC